MTRLFVACLSLTYSIYAIGSPTACPQHFDNGVAPDLLNPKLGRASTPICYEAYALLHSGLTLSALWSAERLTRTSILAAEILERPKGNVFHPESAVPIGQRAELTDYARSGFDRGHLVPSGDAPSLGAQIETFSLANMIPQNSRLNRGAWERIESAVRRFALSAGEVYVITGPAYLDDQIATLKGRVYVPTHVWKVVYNPNNKQSGVCWFANADVADYEVITVNDLTKRIGVDVLPTAPAQSKGVAMALPQPVARKYRPPSFVDGDNSLVSGFFKGWGR